MFEDPRINIVLIFIAALIVIYLFTSRSKKVATVYVDPENFTVFANDSKLQPNLYSRQTTKCDTCADGLCESKDKYLANLIANRGIFD